MVTKEQRKQERLSFAGVVAAALSLAVGCRPRFFFPLFGIRRPRPLALRRDALRTITSTYEDTVMLWALFLARTSRQYSLSARSNRSIS
jgi:hypothetical protein